MYDWRRATPMEKVQKDREERQRYTRRKAKIFARGRKSAAKRVLPAPVPLGLSLLRSRVASMVSVERVSIAPKTPTRTRFLMLAGMALCKCQIQREVSWHRLVLVKLRRDTATRVASSSARKEGIPATHAVAHSIFENFDSAAGGTSPRAEKRPPRTDESTAPEAKRAGIQPEDKDEDEDKDDGQGKPNDHSSKNRSRRSPTTALPRARVDPRRKANLAAMRHDPTRRPWSGCSLLLGTWSKSPLPPELAHVVLGSFDGRGNGRGRFIRRVVNLSLDGRPIIGGDIGRASAVTRDQIRFLPQCIGLTEERLRGEVRVQLVSALPPCSSDGQ
ncbi:MAG: hypothetical protein M1816_004647 [Peltula sp. TS41687]|nr:MAG: hypothetical protein M1816_004647 [Peltula sp. TS41687]